MSHGAPTGWASLGTQLMGISAPALREGKIMASGSSWPHAGTWRPAGALSLPLHQPQCFPEEASFTDAR